MINQNSVTTVELINIVLKIVLSPTKMMTIPDYLNAHKNVMKNIHMKVIMQVVMVLVE